MVAACFSVNIAKEVQYLLSSSTLRINTSNDIYGVELAGALKNVLAIAAGIVDGLGLDSKILLIRAMSRIMVDKVFCICVIKYSAMFKITVKTFDVDFYSQFNEISLSGSKFIHLVPLFFSLSHSF